jgi:hypothetical protein
MTDTEGRYRNERKSDVESPCNERTGIIANVPGTELTSNNHHIIGVERGGKTSFTHVRRDMAVGQRY